MYNALKLIERLGSMCVRLILFMSSEIQTHSLKLCANEVSLLDQGGDIYKERILFPVRTNFQTMNVVNQRLVLGLDKAKRGKTRFRKWQLRLMGSHVTDAVGVYTRTEVELNSTLWAKTRLRVEERKLYTYTDKSAARAK